MRKKNYLETLKKCPGLVSLPILLNSSISVLRRIVFQIVGRFYQWLLYLRMLGKGLQLKTTTLLVFFLWLLKSLKIF